MWKPALLVSTFLTLTVATADAETISLRCNDAGKGDRDPVPEYFTVDVPGNSVSYNRSDGQSYTYRAQISAVAIDFNKGNGEQVHIDRATGVLIHFSASNNFTYSLTCHKAEGF